jgi:hypothetical protein
MLEVTEKLLHISGSNLEPGECGMYIYVIILSISYFVRGEKDIINCNYSKTNLKKKTKKKHLSCLPFPVFMKILFNNFFSEIKFYFKSLKQQSERHMHDILVCKIYTVKPISIKPWDEVLCLE